VPDATPGHRTTPESYLGYARLDRYVGRPVVRDEYALYAFTRPLRLHELAYAGSWRVEAERIVAGSFARLRLGFLATDVHLVLGGKGQVQVLVDGKTVRRVRVQGEPRLYTLVDEGRLAVGRLELRFDPAVTAYAFTFG
jgi:hypothetical protein